MSAQSATTSLRAQQHATRAAFFVPGFALAAWAPIVPFAKASAGLDDAALGLVLLCLGTGSLLAMPLAGVITSREGCRKVLVATALLICATLPLLTIAASPWSLGAVLFLFGMGVGAMDCTMNMQAVMVERDSGKAMMSGFHAFYSIGGFVGAMGITALLSAGVGPWASYLPIVAGIVVVLVSASKYWRADRVSQDVPALALPKGVVIFIGMLCFVTFLAEGSMLDWSAVFLHEVRGVDASRTGIGFVVFSLTMTITRLFGDRLVQRLGRLLAVVLGGVLASTGFLIATLVTQWEAALFGYVLVGLGCANIVPAMFSLAGQQKTMPENIAIPAITTLGYAGVLAGPALIGFVAQATSLVTAFVGVAVAMLGVALSMRWLKV
ncbi:MAG: MFS transporter [Rudaea sp.]|nr:MFS transporter [Rudaea sp.]